MCVIPQMVEDVALAARGIAPVYSFATGSSYPSVKNIIEEANRAIAGGCKEV